jgi:ubiquitin-conjugating enzyme E2 M
VCLNILRLDWNPVLPLTAVMFGLLGILLEPEGEEALNQG